jgi:FkbM family methyltransferase
MDAQTRWYRQSVPLNGEVVADVGANVGKLSAFFFDAVGPKGRVVSIEPLPANVKAIEKRIKKAGPKAKKRWSLKRCAVSAEVGKVTMQVLRADWGTNGLVTSDAEAGEVIEAACRPLTDLAPDATVVKLDIEGHEYAVLPALVPAMPDVHSWLLELHGVEGERLEGLLALFTEAGYRLVAAGQSKADASGAWLSVDIEPTLTWDAVPGTPSIRDGVPNMFKMLHVIATRR